MFRNTTYAVAAVVISFGIGAILQAFLLCRPFAKNWNPLLPGVCGSSTQTILAEAIINMINRRGHHDSTYAVDLAAADGSTKKSYSNNDLWSRLHVSARTPRIPITK